MGPIPASFFFLFTHSTAEKTEGFSGIRTRIVEVEGEHADHLTTTTAHSPNIFSLTAAGAKLSHRGRSTIALVGFGQVVYSDDTSSNPDEDYLQLLVKFLEKNKNG